MYNLLPDGVRYDVEVPDTLDLAERARTAINGLTGVLDTENLHEMYFIVGFACNPPFMYKDTTGWPTNNPKFAESFPMMRIMSGSGQNLDIERGMMQSMMEAIGDDGLFYAIASPTRPWHEGIHHKYPPTGEDFANTYGNSRMLLALMAWYARDRDPALWDVMRQMAHGLAEMAIVKDDYAYYPDGQIGEAFSRPRSGWRDTSEPQVEGMGAEGSMFMYHGGEIRALSRWYEMSGDREILELASRLVRFVMQPRYWGVEGEHPALRGREHGHFTGHFHGHLSLLRGLIEYARVTRDNHVLDFVRESYEFCRHYGLPQSGWFANRENGLSEGCTLGDMVGLAIRLCDVGAGDYWEDVEQIVRNQLSEQHLIDAERLAQASLDGPSLPTEGRRTPESMGRFRPDPAVLPGQFVTENTIERALGVYGGVSAPDGVPNVWTMQCCTGNGTQGLYYAWEAGVRSRAGLATVNLLLNRASPWVDVNSYLPFEGRVELQVKAAERVAVHLPRNVASEDVEVQVDGKPVEATLVGRYLLIGHVSRGSQAEIRFPLEERTVTYTLGKRTYTCRFRGNDLLEIGPRIEDPGSYPMYVHRSTLGKAAPTHTVSRYVAGQVLPW